MAVAPVALADDRAFEDVERGEQRGGAVTLVIMGHRAGTPLLYRQPGLRTVERSDLGFFVHTQHQRVLGRVDVEPDDIA